MTNLQNRIKGSSITVCGTVQGVGFRPFVWHLANKLGVKGEVANDESGVRIKAWAEPAVLLSFVENIRHCSLPLASVELVKQSPIELCEIPSEFRIVASKPGLAYTDVSPDAAICAECLTDITNRSNRRFKYPFTTCTHCGPRLTIIKSIPYDRPNTSMSEFALCKTCLEEYENPADRRFHAQANACNECGPRIWLAAADGSFLYTDDVIGVAADLIRQGQIVAVKGLGGFQLLCDASNEKTVERLRKRKHRFERALALMARDLDVIRHYCPVDDAEAKVLQSSAAPIVIFEAKENHDLASAIAPNQHTLAFMLANTPLHHLLLNRLEKPVICTSGNLSEEPQCTTNADAEKRLISIADYTLFNNRKIINRADDSVVRFIGGTARTLRRARGYAPAPIKLPKGLDLSEDILALGSELKNTFCLLKDGKAILSQYIGDLADARTYADYKQNLMLYEQLFQHKPKHLVVDLHPEYLSTKLGKRFADERGLRLHQVQHHHAHIAACMAENGRSLEESSPVLGIALDGLGYGADQSFWGGEFLLADYTNFKRIASFKSVPLLGGKEAMLEPWRNTYAHVLACMGWENYKRRFGDLELTAFLESKPLAILDSMISAGLNVPSASSCGRLFDAVAAAIGVCRERISYEGQAAIELESLAHGAIKSNPNDTSAYRFQIESTEGKILTIDPASMWQELLEDMGRITSPGLIAARFHRGLAQTLLELTIRLCSKDKGHNVDTVVLSGGVFQNKVFHEAIVTLLSDNGLKVLSPRLVPANDGGISFGQAAICAARLIQGVS